ncbi:MAG: hypothetical protein QG588_17 [Candidatus Poribacteria bacterium]|nr:hypothetical protein [Candidatus Poribacteria bacterium]
MPKDSLEEISGINSEFEGKIVKPILMEDWALMCSKLRSLLMADAYKLEDFEIQQKELDAVRKMGIDRADVHRSMGRNEISELFFWSALKLNNWNKADMNTWLDSLSMEFVDDNSLPKVQELYSLILTISVPQPKGKVEVTENP